MSKWPATASKQQQIQTIVLDVLAYQDPGDEWQSASWLANDYITGATWREIYAAIRDLALRGLVEVRGKPLMVRILFNPELFALSSDTHDRGSP